jgi:hypothetical protein
MSINDCTHPSISRCEATIPWCTDCHQYIDQQTGKPSTARPFVSYAVKQRMDECVELGYDRDTESWQYPEDIW